MHAQPTAKPSNRAPKAQTDVQSNNVRYMCWAQVRGAQAANAQIERTDISVTREVSHVLMAPYVDSAAAELVAYASTAVFRALRDVNA